MTRKCCRWFAMVAAIYTKLFHICFEWKQIREHCSRLPFHQYLAKIIKIILVPDPFIVGFCTVWLVGNVPCVFPLADKKLPLEQLWKMRVYSVTEVFFCRLPQCTICKCLILSSSYREGHLHLTWAFGTGPKAFSHPILWKEYCSIAVFKCCFSWFIHILLYNYGTIHFILCWFSKT